MLDKGTITLFDPEKIPDRLAFDMDDPIVTDRV
jgi:hypothetical protein